MSRSHARGRTQGGILHRGPWQPGTIPAYPIILPLLLYVFLWWKPQIHKRQLCRPKERHIWLQWGYHFDFRKSETSQSERKKCIPFRFVLSLAEKTRSYVSLSMLRDKVSWNCHKKIPRKETQTGITCATKSITLPLIWIFLSGIGFPDLSWRPEGISFSRLLLGIL